MGLQYIYLVQSESIDYTAKLFVCRELIARAQKSADAATRVIVRHIYGILVRMLLKLAPIKIPSLC